MKEFVNKVSQAVRSEMGASHAAAGLTKPEAVTYARSGEIYMAAEPGKQEAPKPKARGKIRRFLFGEGDEAHEQPQQQQERKNGEPEAHARHQQKRADTTPESSENPKKELTVKERLAAVKEVVDLVHDLPHASAAVKNPHAAEIIDRSNSEAGKTLRQAFLNLDNPQVLKTATEDEFATIEHLKERILREADARDIPRELITEDSDKTDTIPDVPDAKEIESLFEELYDLDPQRAALKAAAARAAEEMPDEVKETLEQQRQAYTERMAAEGVTNAANMQARAEPEEEPEPAPQFDLTGITDFQLRQRANQINRTLEQLHSEDMIDLDYVNQASQLISSVEIKNRKGMKEDPIADAQREHQDRLVSELAALRIRVLKEKKAAEDAEMKKRYEQRRLEQRYGSDERDVQDMAAGLDITKANLLLDQGIREQVFANIFANVDATPHEQFRELFDPFTFGRFYKTFIKILREGRDMKPEDFMKQFQNYLLADMLERKDVNATLSKYLRIIISQRRPGLSPEQVDEQVAGALRAQWKNEEKADGKREEQIKFSDTVLNNELLKEAWSRMHGDIIEDFDRFQNERQMREHLHDANSVLYRARVPADALFGYIEQLGNNLADTGFRADGVKQMMDLYESVIRRNIAKKDGYLDPEDIMGRIEGRGGTAEHPKFYAQIAKPVMETETKALFVEMVTAGLIYTTREDGVQVRVTNVQPWEVDRIYTIARGMMVASMRLLSLATESRIPKEQRFTSLAFQDLLQGYSGYRKHLQGKYFVGEGALAIYVMGKRSKILGRLNMPWSTKEAYAKFINMKDNITEILDDEIGAEINLRKDNPNRFGDVFTMIGGWRADPESIGKNATSAMLQAGRGRMVRRILSNGEIQRCIFGNTLNLDGIPTTGSDEAEARWKTLIDDINEDFDENQFKEKPDAPNEIVAQKLLTFIGRASNDPVMGRLAEYIGEHGNWIGTGIRIERYREALDGPKGVSNETRRQDALVAQANARAQTERILERVIDIQPHKIYLNSRAVQKRVRDSLTYPPEKTIDDVMNAMSRLEWRMLQRREKLLDTGYTFHGQHGTEKISLGMTPEELQHLANLEIREQATDNPLTDAERQELEVLSSVRADLVLTKQFRDKMREDWQNKGDKYIEEYIDKREYNHGFVLWSGDVPVDEFHFSATGPTGGFVRKAGDNKDHFQAIAAEIELTKGLKNIDGLDYTNGTKQLVELLEKVWTPLQNADASAARYAMIEKVEGILKLYTADWKTRIPVVGLLMNMTGKSSLAQLVYNNKQLPAWTAREANFFLQAIEHKRWLHPEDMTRMKKEISATEYDKWREISGMVAKFALFAIIFTIFSRAFEGQY